MIRLIQFGRRVADFPITPMVVASLPKWDEMIEKHREYKPEICDVDWPRVDDLLEDPEGAREHMLENWSKLVNNHIINDYDIAMNKIIVVAKFTPSVLETRRIFMEKYRDKPEVYLYLQNFIWLYCPLNVRDNRKEFSHWIVV